MGLYRQLLGYTPIVGIFGHRQVGKSTFLANVVGAYRTLDDLESLELASRSPKTFIAAPHTSPLGIDECQMEPKLFPTLKEWVRTHKKPGQFVLSGSVRFTSRKAIRESLAGRIALTELLPLSVSEIAGDPLSDSVFNLFNHRIFSENSLSVLNSPRKERKFKKYFDQYLESGGLPGLCFIRNHSLRMKALNDLHDLVLGRDLRLVSEVRTPILTLKRLLAWISQRGFTPYNAQEVKRTLGLAPQTQSGILFALESMFLIRRIRVPLRRKEIVLLEDQYEENAYAGKNLGTLGRLEGAVYRNLRNQFAYRLDANVTFESYLTRDHARVPLVIRNENQSLGIIVLSTDKPSLSESRSASSFLRAYGNAKLIYLTHERISPRVLDERSMLSSITAVL